MKQVPSNAGPVGTEAADETPRKRGRPKDPILRQRIVSHARDLFLAHGFQAVAVDRIAADAGVSNRTVFSHFPSKDQLLWAVIVAEGESSRPQLPEELPKTAREFRSNLREFGLGLVSLLTSPNIVRLGNLMLSEAGRHPEMAREFYQWGPKRTRQTLIKWIEWAKSNGWLSKNAPSHAGDHLIALWQGTWQLPQQLGLKRPMSPQQIETHVEDCLMVFFKAFSVNHKRSRD